MKSANALRLLGCIARPRRVFFRSFSTAPPTHGVENGKEEANKGPAGGWYSAESIDRRLRMRRSRNPTATAGTRSATKLSDEDYYMAAGAPGYTDTDLAEAAEKRARASIPRQDLSIDELDGDEADAIAEAISRQNSAPPLPILRRTTFTLPLASFPGFSAAWELRAVPAFRGLSGCLGVTVLLRGVPEGATLAELLATARSGARGDGSVLTVEVASAWATPAAIAGAHEDAVYLAAMNTLASFLPPPEQQQQQASPGSAAAGGGAGAPSEHWVILSEVRPPASSGEGGRAVSNGGPAATA